MAEYVSLTDELTQLGSDESQTGPSEPPFSTEE